MKAADHARFCETKRARAELNRVQLDGTFEGYASVYNQVDLGNDIIAPGAFDASLTRRGAAGVRMLFQHDPSEPIGVWETLDETPMGLFARGRLALATARGREVHELMRAGAIDGLSIGFRTLRAHAGNGKSARRITEADLWEISIVTFPMQEQARITAVKQAAPTMRKPLPDVREFERWLVREAGLSRGDARRVIAKGYRNCLSGRDAGNGNRDLATAIRQAATRFNS